MAQGACKFYLMARLRRFPGPDRQSSTRDGFERDRMLYSVQLPREARNRMDVTKIPPGRNPPDDINVLIEIPQGGVPVKYELDKASGALFVNRFLHTAMYYPANYGFIPNTLSEDGDPCDVLALSWG
jgi:Inorganic pyrophosphatase